MVTINIDTFIEELQRKFAEEVEYSEAKNECDDIIGTLVGETKSYKIMADYGAIYANGKGIIYMYNDRHSATPVFERMIKVLFPNNFIPHNP